MPLRYIIYALHYKMLRIKFFIIIIYPASRRFKENKSESKDYVRA